MCTGTGDLAIAAVTDPRGRAAEVVGIDFAGEMLRLGLDKIRAQGLARSIRLARGDATAMPLPDASFDAAMVAFGIRNVIDPARACAEFRRVLRPGGRLAILEFGTPTLPGLRQMYGWYFRNVLPRIGRLVSRHADAYSHLPASVESFPPARLLPASSNRRVFLRGAAVDARRRLSLPRGKVIPDYWVTGYDRCPGCAAGIAIAASKRSRPGRPTPVVQPHNISLMARLRGEPP